MEMIHSHLKELNYQIPTTFENKIHKIILTLLAVLVIER